MLLVRVFPFFCMLWTQYSPAVHEIYDEPGLKGLPPAVLHQRYLDFKRAHPGQIAAVSFVGCDNIEPYVGSFDQMLPDYYIFYRGDPLGNPLELWRETTQQCVALARQHHLRPPVMVGQAFGEQPDTDYWWRCPTRYEAQQMIAISRQEGAAGLLWFWQTTAGTTCPWIKDYQLLPGIVLATREAPTSLRARRWCGFGGRGIAWYGFLGFCGCRLGKRTVAPLPHVIEAFGIRSWAALRA